MNTRLVSCALGAGVALVGCGDDGRGIEPPGPGVVLTYPGPDQLDVPLGTRVVVSFSDPVNADSVADCSAFCVVGPEGPVGTPEVIGEGNVVAVSPTLAPDTEYEVFARPALLDGAENLSESEPLFRFRTRAARPRAAQPALVAVNGGAPASLPGAQVLDFDSIRLVFSEPLDRRSVDYGSTVALLDSADNLVPARLLAKDLHVTVDPDEDLTGGATYQLVVGEGLVDLGGDSVAPMTIRFTPVDTRGVTGLIDQTLRTRLEGDPGPEVTRAGVPGNTVSMIKPLIGAETLRVGAGQIASQLGDPKSLGGPIPFVIRAGGRLAMAGIDVKLGGEIPAGLSTGDLEVHFLSDASGVLSRNPWRDPGVIPDNQRAPVYAELRFDIGVTARDATGLVVLSQTVLGVQATGTATPTDGVLAIEAVASLEMDLLGVTKAPTNMVLELITDDSIGFLPDRTSPALVASYPADEALDFRVGDGVELTFDEPIDIGRARAGGIRLEAATGDEVPSVLEVHGGTVVVRPLAPLDDGVAYAVVLDDVADLAGNTTASTIIGFETAPLAGNGLPPHLMSIHPGVPCALEAGGRCAGGGDTDDLYSPFALAADENIEAVFTQPLAPGTVALGADCGQGSVRVEQLDSSGACTAAVPGTLIRRDRGFGFISDQPWQPGQRYRLSLISGGDGDCDAGELCGAISGSPASFDPLSGLDGEAGGPDLVVEFTGAEPRPATFVPAQTVPLVDQNGSGTVDGFEVPSDLNRAALRITGVGGDVDDARIVDADCVPETPEVEGCMYLTGSVPVAMGELTTDCPLPDGTSAPSCLPVFMSPQLMFGTSVTMEATAFGISPDVDTDSMVLRVREPGEGPVTGYLIDDGGTPTLVVELSLYMDAPDMSIISISHDLQSKEARVLLSGPLSYFPDGRIQINLTNRAAIDLTVNLDGPFGTGGFIDTQVPAGEMRLQLLSNPLRGGER